MGLCLLMIGHSAHSTFTARRLRWFAKISSVMPDFFSNFRIFDESFVVVSSEPNNEATLVHAGSESLPKRLVPGSRTPVLTLPFSRTRERRLAGEIIDPLWVSTSSLNCAEECEAWDS
eukprot:5301864-Prymnesium_polylepis.3